MSCNEYWHAIFVATGEENKVKERLGYTFGDSTKLFVPKRKLKERKNGVWQEKIRTLFPGYVLLQGGIGIEQYAKIRNTPGIIKLLRSGYEPLKIESYEMEVIKHLTFNFKDEIIGTSDILFKNQQVVVLDGPLLSMEGFIVSLNSRKGRAKVMLNFLGELRTIELGIDVLQPA